MSKFLRVDPSCKGSVARKTIQEYQKFPPYPLAITAENMRGSPIYLKGQNSSYSTPFKQAFQDLTDRFSSSSLTEDLTSDPFTA